jgi:glutamate N-acetyltransferase/amino-acid N-acetyltransferase
MKRTFIKGGITAPSGFRASGIHAGIKPPPNLDLALILSDKEAVMAGVFTKNRLPAAPVILDRQRLKGLKGRAIIMNSGNANACTGSQGLKDARTMTQDLAKYMNNPTSQVFVASTGIIGHPLPISKIQKAIPSLVKKARLGGHIDAAKAIMTTDTVHKEMALEIPMGAHSIKIGGMAKGSGMIHPNMATMLAFITTDATISPRTFQKALTCAVAQSFNCISVDGDTSTNDTVLAMANGMTEHPVIQPHTKAFQVFQEGLSEVCKSLALKVCQDGEGKTKVVLVKVQGAKTTNQAKKIAHTIVTSPLVKTALFGEDPNWGRFMAAIGRAGVPINPQNIDLHFDNIQVVKGGLGLPSTQMKRAKRIMKQPAFEVTVSMGKGPGSFHFWTNDLTYNYIAINTAYPT